jgi:hypothetical protein
VSQICSFFFIYDTIQDSTFISSLRAFSTAGAKLSDRSSSAHKQSRCRSRGLRRSGAVVLSETLPFYCTSNPNAVCLPLTLVREAKRQPNALRPLGRLRTDEDPSARRAGYFSVEKNPKIKDTPRCGLRHNAVVRRYAPDISRKPREKTGRERPD